jgi:hypothetical protein
MISLSTRVAQPFSGFEPTHAITLKIKFYDIKWLNMEPKPDKECEKRGDIGLLTEIIANLSAAIGQFGGKFTPTLQTPEGFRIQASRVKS